jgi:hypothetical protein
MRSDGIATVDECGYAMRRQWHAIFVAELAEICRRPRETLSDRTVSDAVLAMA